MPSMFVDETKAGARDFDRHGKESNAQQMQLIVKPRISKLSSKGDVCSTLFPNCAIHNLFETAEVSRQVG